MLELVLDLGIAGHFYPLVVVNIIERVGGELAVVAALLLGFVIRQNGECNKRLTSFAVRSMIDKMAATCMALHARTAAQGIISKILLRTY